MANYTTNKIGVVIKTIKMSVNPAYTQYNPKQKKN